jgi:hypothetical protein
MEKQQYATLGILSLVLEQQHWQLRSSLAAAKDLPSLHHILPKPPITIFFTHLLSMGLEEITFQ